MKTLAFEKGADPFIASKLKQGIKHLKLKSYEKEFSYLYNCERSEISVYHALL